MKERFSKVLMTSVLSVLLGASMSNLSADSYGWDRGNNFDANCGQNWDQCCYDNNNCCDPRFSVAIDWLYWDACQEDTDVVIANANTNSPLSNAETKYFNYRYKSGFRIAASYHLPCDGLSLDFVYTYWHPRFSNTFTPPNGGSLNGTGLSSRDSGTDFAEAQTGVKIKYDMYDLLLSKVISYGECSKLRPYFGFRCLDLQQEWNTQFTPAVTGAYAYSQWRFHFPAYGVTLGVEGKYHVCGNVSLIGRLGGSILGGDPKHHNQSLNGASYVSEHRKHCQVINGLDGYLGLAYDTTCCCWPVDLAIGYEVQDWWNTPQRPRFVNDGQVTGDSSSRFTVHGLFVRGGVSF